MTLTGIGFQFSLTPSMIKTFLVVGLYVNVNGNGPANLLASFQSANGDPSGNGIASLSVFSIQTLNPDFF